MAEVYKCVDKAGKIDYQARPCQNSVKTVQLPIKNDPAKDASAKLKLQELESEYQAKKDVDNAEKQAELQNNLLLQQAQQNGINLQNQQTMPNVPQSIIVNPVLPSTGVK